VEGMVESSDFCCSHRSYRIMGSPLHNARLK
jgi:hypothetical protein